MLKGLSGSGGGSATDITVGVTTITGGTNTRVLFDDSGVLGESAGLTYVKGTGTLSATALVGGNVTDSALTSGRVVLAGAAGILADSAALTFNGTILLTTGVVQTGAGTSSNVSIGIGAANTGFYNRSGSSVDYLTAGVAQFDISNGKFSYVGTGTIGFASGDPTASVIDVGMSRLTTNAITFSGGSTSGSVATSRTEINKSVTAIADATPTATFTVTIPNAAHSGMLKVTLVGSLGAGGAIGANEANATISYDIAIARTAGVNAVATISTAYGSAASAVAGAATVTVTAAVSAISGAVGATNTFTVNVTITKSGGSSANHTCLCYGRLMNANATGITIA